MARAWWKAASPIVAAMAMPAWAQSATSAPLQPPETAQPAGSATLDPAPAAAAATSFRRYDDLSIKGWDIPFPKTEDTILADRGGIRDALADHGIGILFTAGNYLQYDFLQNDGRYRGPQLYNGQRVTRTSSYVTMYAAYDLGEIGIDEGQINLTLNYHNTSFTALNSPNRFRVPRLAYFQSLFGGRVELKLGINDESTEFFGTNVAGSLATGSLGPLANIPYQVGVNYSGFATPALNVKVNFKNHFYDKIGVQRSLPPGGAGPEVALNPSGFTFAPRGTNALFIDEFGYKRASSAGVKSTWFRGGGIYNLTRYDRFDGNGTARNWALFAAVDQQLTQPDPTRAFRGAYAGLTINHAPSVQNRVTNYVEARLYGIGLIAGRPFDLASLVATYSTYGDPARRALPKPGDGSYPDTTTIIGSYGYRLLPGFYLQPGLGITIHPLVTPRFKPALNGYLGVSLLF